MRIQQKTYNSLNVALQQCQSPVAGYALYDFAMFIDGDHSISSDSIMSGDALVYGGTRKPSSNKRIWVDGFFSSFA